MVTNRPTHQVYTHGAAGSTCPAIDGGFDTRYPQAYVNEMEHFLDVLSGTFAFPSPFGAILVLTILPIPSLLSSLSSISSSALLVIIVVIVHLFITAIVIIVLIRFNNIFVVVITILFCPFLLL